MDRESVGLFDSNFTREWEKVLPRKGAVGTSAFSRVIAAVDASHYLLTPSAVVTPESLDEISALFTHATQTNQQLTFRSGGTSLSGQAATEHILVDIRKNFRTIEVLENGVSVRVGPGATVRQVNARLARFGRKLGPDPASEIACTIGGVVANNSSGMSCGITQNTYRTLKSIVAVLPSGTIIDTSSPDANEQLRELEPTLFKTLSDLHLHIANTPHLKSEILRQFSIKNTMGYGINSLVDFNTPIDIFTHLLVGSEGTLAFIAEATFETIPVLTKVSTGFLVFESLQVATDSLSAIVASKPIAIELLDSASLLVLQKDPLSKGVLPDIEYLNHAALLVEYQAAEDLGLETLENEAKLVFDKTKTAIPIIFTSDSKQREALWHLRKGLYAAIAGGRPSGTTALLEDIAVPVDRLSAICLELQGLFAKHGYDDAVIFGHAKDGNLHFLLNEDFENPDKVIRYRDFTEDMVEAVLREGGSLKAEHGTGRIMAPFVRRQYGAELHEMMFVIKAAFDPNGILNPDVILTRDPDLHLRNLKTTPIVEEEVDRCVECGYCEPVCPSQDLTTTPRQRIVLSRAIASAVSSGNRKLEKELTAEQRYQVVDTCAVDGMCQTACPVSINTGDLVRKLRRDSVSPLAQSTWMMASRNWKTVTEIASKLLTVASASPKGLVVRPNKLARRLFGEDVLPMWSPDLPRGGSKRTASSSTSTLQPNLIYFKACVGTMFGTSDKAQGVSIAFESLLKKADLNFLVPKEISSLCCGTPWKSKGMTDGYKHMVELTIDSLWAASKGGEIAIVSDNSSCSEGLLHALHDALSYRPPEYQNMNVMDAIDYVAVHVLPKLEISQSINTMALHPTCSSTRSGSNENLTKIANSIAKTATIPEDWGCCAFAGDRGMLHPELAESATTRESVALLDRQFDAYASCNRTCEIGMTRATGREYRHILELLDETSKEVA